MRVHDLLRGKASPDVFTILPSATVDELVLRLAERDVGALVVSADGLTVAGIVSERDVVRHLPRSSGALDAVVADIMTAEVDVCRSNDEVHGLMQLMTDRRIRHVPVVDDGVLVGVVSIGDVVKHRIDELEFERDQLGAYLQHN